MPHVEQLPDSSRLRLRPDQTLMLNQYFGERAAVQNALMRRTGDETNALQWAVIYADRFRELFLSNKMFRELVLLVAHSISESTPTDAMTLKLSELQKLLERSPNETHH